MRKGQHTLRLSEDALLDTSLQGSVEERIKHAVGSVELVVGLDIFLEGSTTILSQHVL